jgi:hypothetical protein
LPDDKLTHASYHFFQRLKLFAIFSKHYGFREENEWRVAYMIDRDTDKAFAKMISYSVGPRGVEPKLKLKPIPGSPKTDVSLSKIVERIILGPSISSRLAFGAIWKMLDELKKSDLKQRIVTSTIPFRAVPFL